MKQMLVKNSSVDFLYHYSEDGLLLEGAHMNIIVCNGTNCDKKLYGDCTRIYGNINSGNLYGDCTGLRGFIFKLIGNCTGVFGDCTLISGNIDDCDISDEERKNGVAVSDLIK